MTILSVVNFFIFFFQNTNTKSECEVGYTKASTYRIFPLCFRYYNMTREQGGCKAACSVEKECVIVVLFFVFVFCCCFFVVFFVVVVIDFDQHHLVILH